MWKSPFCTFVIKTIAEPGYEPVPGVHQFLQGRLAPIGWSDQDYLDLREIQRIRDTLGEHGFNPEQRAAAPCLPFLEGLGARAVLFYPHQPFRDVVSAVYVSGSYRDYLYLPAAQSLNGDFRSARRCILLTPHPVGRDHPGMRAALWHDLFRRRGRLWEIKSHFDVIALLQAL